MTDILRYNAFAAEPWGGNAAGVVPDASALDDERMLAIAAELGYAETAFVTRPPRRGPTTGAPARATVRYFSPVAEVPFCGHATVATAVVLAERLGTGPYVMDTAAGEIVLDTRQAGDTIEASFTSVEPWVRPLADTVLADLLEVLGLRMTDLDADFPPRESYAGNPHPVLVLADRTVFDQFRFSPAAAAALMKANGWTGTITVAFARGPSAFDVRNVFIAGRINEDPATGSAAASVGAYLREIGAIAPPARVTLRQGAHVGRPSLLVVDVPISGGITVTGTAVPIQA